MNTTAFTPAPSLLLPSRHHHRAACSSLLSPAIPTQHSPWTMISTTPSRVTTPERTTVTVTPERQRQTKQPNMYRLYIYNDPINRRERVVDVLLKTCDGLSFSRAYAAMQEAHENGRGLVLIIAQEIAEHYCACINSGTFYLFPLFSFSRLVDSLSCDLCSNSRHFWWLFVCYQHMYMCTKKTELASMFVYFILPPSFFLQLAC